MNKPKYPFHEFCKLMAKKVGIRTQNAKLVEELGELQAAIKNYKAKPTEKKFDQIVEEIADVELILAQFKLNNGCYVDVMEIKEQKQARTEERFEL